MLGVFKHFRAAADGSEGKDRGNGQAAEKSPLRAFGGTKIKFQVF